MRDYVAIGSTSAEEDCETLGPNYDPIKARIVDFEEIATCDSH